MGGRRNLDLPSDAHIETGENASISEFDSRLFECLNAGLDRFGPGVAQAIVSNLKWFFNIRVEEIPKKPEEFETCLDYIFGSGSAYVKREIANEIKAKFHLTDDYTNLKDYFDAASKTLERVATVLVRH
jgi:hypothetical protein